MQLPRTAGIQRTRFDRAATSTPPRPKRCVDLRPQVPAACRALIQPRHRATRTVHAQMKGRSGVRTRTLVALIVILTLLVPGFGLLAPSRPSPARAQDQGQSLPDNPDF